MELPLVSVVIPFYSNIIWLEEALSSVKKQTYPNIEILLINDGSEEDISEIEERIGLSITIIEKDNGGPASARNLGIEKASGKYIAFLDSDDVWKPNKLSKQIEYMETKQIVWSQHSYEMFWEEKNKAKKIDTKKFTGDVYRDTFISLKIQTSCVVVLRSVLLSNNIQFPIDMRYGQDLAFYRKLAEKYPLGYVDGILSKFRIRGMNAGFRAKVQLNDKSHTWQEIKQVKSTLSILPKPIVIAYFMSDQLSRVVNKVNKYCIRNENAIEPISKVLYVFPYFLFKAYARK